MTSRPRILIGAPPEELAIAEHLHRELTPHAGCVLWPHGTIGLTGTTIGRFLTLLKEFDIAILVLSADDLAQKHPRGRKSPRDNALFEVGLFVGAMGGRRVFVVYDRDATLDLPTDLAGVSTAGFTRRIRGNLKSALDPVFVRIKRALGALQPRPDSVTVSPSQMPPSSNAWTFLDKLSADLAAVGADVSSQAVRIRRRSRAPSTEPPPSSRTLTASATSRLAPLPGHMPGERALRFMEGVWRDPDTGAIAYARIHEGQLRFIYSLTGNGITGECYDFRLGSGAVTGRFRWIESSLRGYIHFHIDDKHRLRGGWWYHRDVPEALLDSLPDVDGMRPITWVREPESATVPLWAERFFRRLRVDRAARR